MMKALSNHAEFSCHDLKHPYSTTTHDVSSLFQCVTAEILGFWLAVCSAVSENRKTLALEQRENRQKWNRDQLDLIFVIESEKSVMPNAC